MTGLARSGPAITHALGQALVEQRGNWPCWMAVALGAGIAVYFGLPAEPPLWLGAGLSLAGLAVAVFVALSHRCRPLLWPALFAGVFGLGLTAAGWQTLTATPNMLAEDEPGEWVTGRVASLEPLPTGWRLRLVPAYLGRAGAATAVEPRALRITVFRAPAELAPGDWVRLRADLRPPTGPAIPGAYDFRRQAFFDGLDGTGMAYRLTRLETPADRAPSDFWESYDDWADALRQKIGRRIAEILPDASGALAIALVVGNQTAMRKTDLDAMRDSGLAHLLSISGLHISLAAGLVFVTARFLMALTPWLALRAPIKKWAAVMALGGAIFYAILAGATVPTQRSVIMAGIAFGAILLDRSPISLRLVAWSAVALLLWRPDSLAGASFQMSFAAVFALIACFDALRRPLLATRQAIAAPGADTGGRILAWLGVAAFWLLTMMLSSLIASLATAPFGLYHFNRLQLYGIAANMLAVPITGFWIMPAAVIALLLMPLGLDAPFLWLLGKGCALVLWVAHAVQDWPQSVMAVPVMPVWGLLVGSAGLIWFCLGKGWGRGLGLIGAALMIFSIVIAPRPDILISASGRLIALRGPDGQLTVSSNRAERLVRETWLRRAGQDSSVTFDRLPAGQDWITCTYPDSCIATVSARRILFDLGRVPSPVDCRAAEILIVPQRQIACPTVSGTADQPTPPLVIDRRVMQRSGATALYLKAGSTVMETAAEAIGQRPWSPFLRASEPQSSADADIAGTSGGDETVSDAAPDTTEAD